MKRLHTINIAHYLLHDNSGTLSRAKYTLIQISIKKIVTKVFIAI